LGVRVDVVRARAQDLRGVQVPVVTARAVAPLDRLFAMTAHLLQRPGRVLALKGSTAADELAAAAAVLRGGSAVGAVHKVTVAGQSTFVVEIQLSGAA
jgi:16S rRNA (guanine527-N7)-methyltransferase